jgi:hypothetical protein
MVAEISALPGVPVPFVHCPSVIVPSVRRDLRKTPIVLIRSAWNPSKLRKSQIHFVNPFAVLSVYAVNGMM